MSKLNTPSWNSDKICPRCGWGTVIEKRGKFGKFFGCSDWPQCEYTESERQFKSDWNDGWDDLEFDDSDAYCDDRDY